MTATDRPLPRESPDRCAPLAQERDDPMIGTALPTARLILVEQPGPWGPRGLLDDRDEARAAHEIDVLAAAAGLRLQAVRHPGRHARAEDRRLVAVVDTVSRTTYRWEVGGLSDVLQQLEAARRDDPADTRTALLDRAPDLVHDTDPLYLVCTHGRHDACCALRGRPLVDALHALRPERVWETTHVGGDRFAANVVVAPTGEFYGRVLPGDAADLVQHTERDEVLPRLMRGRMGLAPVVQAALVVAHDHLGLAGRDALGAVGLDRPSDDRALVTVVTPDGTVVVEVAITTSEPTRLTCQGPATARARVYHGVGVTATA